MGFRCGIVGLPNVGKSTIFNALTRTSVPASNYPFCTIEPNVGVVPVPDGRLATLTKLGPAERMSPTSIEFIDIAGLVQGASQGEGLGNQFLSHIAETDAIAHVVRCFEDAQVAHVNGSLDPKRDIEVVNLELALKDLAAVTAAHGRVDKLARSGNQNAEAAAEILQQVITILDHNMPLRLKARELSPDAQAVLRPLNLLTAKPVVYVANMSEPQVRTEDAMVTAVREVAEAERAPMVPLCGSIEEQIARLDTEAERAEFLEAEGLPEPGLTRLVRAGYEALGLITYFTVAAKEGHARTLRRGATALEAAAQVHTDMARGFIRAEVISFDEFVACDGEAGARAQGKLRTEGKEYVVQDGDIMRFRFNV